MAIAFRSKADVSNAASTTAVVSKPSGTTDGDMLVAFIAWSNNRAITPPVGWTLRGGYSDELSNWLLACYTKVASSEGSSWTWTFAASAANVGYVAAYSAPHASAPFDGIAGTSGIAGGSAVAAPSVVTSHDGDMVIAAVGGRPNSGLASWAAPSGMTEREDSVSASSRTLAVADVVQSAAGATGAKSFAASGGTFGQGASVTLILRGLDVPTVSSISPSHGPIDGGDSVTIVGTHFTGATGVTIGGVACTSVVVVDDQTITCVVPAGTVGNKTVTVTTPSGSGSLT